MTSSELVHVQLLLAENLKRYRKQARLSQEALAHAASIDRTYVSQLERAQVNPSLAVLVRVAGVFEITLCDLLSPN